MKTVGNADNFLPPGRGADRESRRDEETQRSLDAVVKDRYADDTRVAPREKGGPGGK
jgi:hypothetical protein